MRTIYKFPLELKDRQQIVVQGTIIRPLSVQVQHDKICLWTMVQKTGDEVSTHTVYIIGTGHEIPTLVQPEDYVGTVQSGNGTFIWHVFIV